MPEPRPNEDHDSFIERCMSDDEAKEDFPDTDQRLAFCESVWQQNGMNIMSKNEIERRAFAVDELRVERLDDESGAPKIRGHAAVFNSLSEDLGGFREQISPGAFGDAIGRDDIRALFNHNPDFVLGRNKSGTLRLSEDRTGLAVEIDPPDTQVARDLAVSIERGDINQMSFGFRVDRDGQEFEDREGQIIRTLTRVALFDVSPVTYPAYPATDVAVRSMDAWLKERQEIIEAENVDASAIHAIRTRLRLKHDLRQRKLA